MQDVDFLPDEIRHSREHRRRLLSQCNLLVICALALLALAGLRHERLRQARAELGVLTERTERASEQLDLLAELRQKQSELKLKRQVAADMGSSVEALDVLAVITDLAPEAVAMRSLRLETVELRQQARPDEGGDQSAPRVAMGSEPETATVRRLQLRMTGIAPSDVEVANFIAALATNPLLEDITMGYARDVEFRGRRAREFQVSCYVVR